MDEENLGGEFSVQRMEKELADRDEQQGLSWWSSDHVHLWPEPKE